MRAARVPAYLERSGSGLGYHLWSFFEPAIPAEDARRLGHVFAPQDAQLSGGGVASPASARGIEVFPKQGKLTSSGLGNLVWLPFWAQAVDGGCVFYRQTSSGLEAFWPTSFETVPASLVASLAPRTVESTPTAHTPAKASPKVAGGKGNRDWAAWKEEALAALPLEAVYGQWLTGNSKGSGWLECRDPASGSGDQHPSAGVADGTGEARRAVFHSFISGASLSVFDFLVQYGGCADHSAACARVAELSGVPSPTVKLETDEALLAWAGDFLAPPVPPEAPAGGTPPKKERPTIQVNQRQLRDVIADSWSAVLAANEPPRVFVRAGMVSHLESLEHGPEIRPLSDVGVFGVMARVANWVREVDKGQEHCPPCKDAARDMTTFPHERLPRLKDVVHSPVFDHDGRLVLEPGYHANAQLWLHRPPGFEIEPVPENPSAEDVQHARDLIVDELLGDFPFVDEADRSHAVAAILGPITRRLVRGRTPFHLFEAPSPGTGKGLAADLVALVNTGHLCEPTTLTPNEDETRKKITSVLARAPPVALIDNVKDRLDSAQLAALSTADVWSDRLLGFSQMVQLPNQATWLITANNPSLSTELNRRCVRIRLDAKVERPWLRAAFRHDRLREWALENRGRLVHALLVLVRHWLASGRPRGRQTLGSFEAWAEVMGGILENAGVEGFLGNLEAQYESGESGAEAEWGSFVAAWAKAYGERWVNVSALLALATERSLLGAVLRDGSPKSQQSRLGKALRTRRDQVRGAWRVELSTDTSLHTSLYRLAPAKESRS
jgi:hypothetical protein